MATTIRMQRGGRTHAPYYRIVVMDSRNRDRGRVLDQLGIYHPCARPEPKVEMDAEKALNWLKKGATTSRTVRDLLSRLGVMKAFATGAAIETPVPATEASVEAPAAVAPETPAETAPEVPVEAAPEATAETPTEE